MARMTRSHAKDDRPLAQRIGAQLRLARGRAGLTQAALAEGRYTKAYVSALENGLVKPSLAALNYFADRLGVPVTSLIGEPSPMWTRLEADLRLAAGDWLAAADAYEALLAAAAGVDRAELLRGLAEASCRLEKAPDALRAATEAVRLFESARRPLDMAWASYWQAFALYELEESTEARIVLDRIDNALATGPADPDLRVRVAIARAMIESRDDEPERALVHLEAARGAATDLDDRRRATFLFSLALSYREVGDYEGAVRAAHQSLALFKAANAELEIASIENELALVYLGLGNTDAAEAHASAAHSAFARLGNDRWLAHVKETSAQIELARGDLNEAISMASQARDGAASTGNRKAQISSLLTLGRAYQASNELPAARAALVEAADLARVHARRSQLQMVLGELADLLAQSGDIEAAFALSQEALRVNRHVVPVTTPVPATPGAGVRQV